MTTNTLDHRTLPLPRWWVNNSPATEESFTDLCIECGHARDLQAPEGCTTQSYFGENKPCLCRGASRWVRAEGTHIEPDKIFI